MKLCPKALLLAGLALAAALQAQAQAQEMPAPRFALGDSWSYRETDLLTKNQTGQLTETVTAVDAAEYRIDARRLSRTGWRGDAVKLVHREQWLHAEEAPDQRGRVIATNDAGCAYPWPLKVGQSFACSEDTTWPNGWRLRYDLKFTVEAAESVQTAAGPFEALRVTGKGYANNLSTNTVSRHERTVWLAPAAKREVRHEIRTVLRNGTVFKAEGRELVSFKAGGS